MLVSCWVLGPLPCSLELLVLSVGVLPISLTRLPSGEEGSTFSVSGKIEDLAVTVAVAMQCVGTLEMHGLCWQPCRTHTELAIS